MKIDPNRLKRMYPEVSDEFAERMRRMTRALPSEKEEEKVKKKLSFAMAAALALALLMAGAALAAGTGVLDYIFKGASAPTEKQKTLVQAVNARHASEGVTTRITEALIDGTRLDLAYQFDTERPVWVETLGVTVNGQKAAGMTTDVLNQWVMHPFETGKKTATGGETLELTAPVAGAAKVAVRLALLAPGSEVVETDEDHKDAVIASGKVAVQAGEHNGYGIFYSSKAHDDPEDNATYAQLLPYYQLERDLTEEEQARVARLEDDMMTMADLYVEYGNMVYLDEFVLEFTLNAKAEEKIQLNFAELDGLPTHFDVVVERAEIGAMGMDVKLRLYEKEGGWTREEIKENVFLFDFYDEMRQPLAYQDTWMEMSGGGDSYDENGVWCWEVECHMPRPETIPKFIYSVPYSIHEQENPLWEDAVPLFPGDPNDLNG